MTINQLTMHTDLSLLAQIMWLWRNNTTVTLHSWTTACLRCLHTTLRLLKLILLTQLWKTLNTTCGVAQKLCKLPNTQIKEIISTLPEIMLTSQCMQPQGQVLKKEGGTALSPFILLGTSALRYQTHDTVQLVVQLRRNIFTCSEKGSMVI